MSAYYAQWDKADLDSWQGKEIDAENGDNEDGEDIQSLKIEEEFSPCMADYGMSWSDFM